MNYSAELERLSSRIRVAARDGGLIETAQVKLIGLDEVRQAAGARWPRMREHVRDGSHKIIANHLGIDDAVIACGDGFLVVYAHATVEEIVRRSESIREALMKFYLGEDALKTLQPNLNRQTVTAANLAGIVKNAGTSHRAPQRRNELQLGRFWPVWSLRHKSVVAHLCAPVFETPSGKLRQGYTADFVERAIHRQRDYVDLDLCLLEQACAAAEDANGGPVGVSVHATTLQNRRSRQIYLAHLESNGRELRERMFISVSEIEPGVPLISLCEWSHALKRTFSRVSLELHHSDRALSAIGSTGAWAAGHHLPIGGPTSNFASRKVLNDMHAWCRTLKQQGILPLFHGFEDSGFLDLAGYSDLAFATSPTLWPCVETPAPIASARLPANERSESAEC